MDGCVLLTSTPSCVVSQRGETTHSGVDVNNTHPSMINPLNKWALVSWFGVAAFHLAACVCTSSKDEELIGADKACVLTHAYHLLFSQ